MVKAKEEEIRKGYTTVKGMGKEGIGKNGFFVIILFWIPKRYLAVCNILIES